MDSLAQKLSTLHKWRGPALCEVGEGLLAASSPLLSLGSSRSQCRHPCSRGIPCREIAAALEAPQDHGSQEESQS